MSIHVLRVVRRTADFDAMLHFYRDLLGMTPVSNWDRPGDRGAICRLWKGLPPSSSRSWTRKGGPSRGEAR